MQKVIVVSEDNHSLIRIAKDYPSAVDFLIKDCWLDEATEIYNDAKSEWMRLDEFYGKNWEEEVRRLSRESFEELFDGSFYLEDEEIYGT